AIAGGSARGVPVLVGTNLDEIRAFQSMDPLANYLDEAGLYQRVAGLLGGGPDSEARAGQVIQIYRQARAARGDSTTPPDLWFAMATDHMFRVPAMALAELQA